MAQAARDQNLVTTLLGVSSADGITPVVLWADPVTHRLLVDLAGGAGTVTSISVVTANGVSGSVADPTTTPAITITLGAITPTSVNGLTLASQATGFTIAGGTSSRTLTVDVTKSVSDFELVANKSTDTALGTSDTLYPSQKAVKTYVDGLVAGLLDYRGAYDASVNTFPASGGSGTAGAIMKGDMWVISVAGTLGGVAIQVGDSLIANVDTPGQTAANWNTLQTNISYVPENVANKVTSISGSSTDTEYPSAKLVYDQLATKAPLASPTFTGTVILPTVSLTGVNTFGENSELRLDAALSADGTFCGITEIVTAGETVAFGDVLYLKAADSQWYKAIASADATAGAVRTAIAVTSGTDNNTMTIMTYGKIRADAKFPTMTVGAPVYISGATAGLIVTAQPTTTDYVIRIMGYGNTGDELLFCPSNDYMTHV